MARPARIKAWNGPPTEEVDVVVRLLQAAVLAQSGQPATAALFQEAAETIEMLPVALAVRAARTDEGELSRGARNALYDPIVRRDR